LLAQVIWGGVVSMTVTTWLQRLVFWQKSEATQVRVALKVLPQKPVRLVVVLSIITVTLEPAQRSEAAGGTKLHETPHSTTRLLRQVNCGGVVSTMVMV
jgi:hypothetical protein